VQFQKKEEGIRTEIGKISRKNLKGKGEKRGGGGSDKISTLSWRRRKLANSQRRRSGQC